MKDLYDKRFKSLKKEIKEDLRRWKDLPCSWIGRINIVKMAILWKPICRFNKFPMKILTNFFIELEKQTNKKTLYQKLFSTTGRITITDLMFYYRAIVIKTTTKPVWYWSNDRHEDQEDPEKNPHTYGHLILTKKLKPSRGKMYFQQMVLSQLLVSM